MLNYKKYSDYDLLTLFNTNDERVLIEIYDRYWDKMLAVAFNRLGNLQEAEECVQDVLCKLWKLRSTFSLQNEKLSSYLARAVRNQTFNIIYQNKQKRQKLAGYSPQEDVIDSISPERKLIILELQQQIDKAIKNLPPQCQLVFVMNKNEGLTTKEIADKLNLSENTVKSHLKKAKKDLGNNTEFLTIIVFFSIYLR
ncbi:RNA polymerase sigma-70 factor (family 1) [Sphingobacterium zeae]|uniref:RNA polymerase sigma-70 factor (Family 1) n=1 Tax=Sphingobacterium zeae TaxID=1776859 RepID=A0ABU0U8F8_9SPHI|nr:RNA polymerase sigma-70 factor [Sphingobacterium zeae]MDQ1151248.1 RNA polymerase sigma-70 factor (family 1) [Sphingobacterium zeae]